MRVEAGEVYVDVPDDAKRQRTMPMAAYDPDADGRTFVVVGGGAVAATAVATLREAGFTGRVVVISAEDRWPYDRPNLSKDFLAGEAGADWLPLRPDAFYERHGIERMHDTVTGLDVAARRLELERRRGHDAGRGAHRVRRRASPPRPYPAPTWAASSTLRSWDDCERLIAAAEHADQVVVIGASFIGMEVAASLTHRGRQVTVVAPDDVPFARTLGADRGRDAASRSRGAGHAAFGSAHGPSPCTATAR